MFPDFDSLPSKADLVAVRLANATHDKLDRLQVILYRHLDKPGPVSIPAIGKDLGLTRQAVTYQLQLLERDRGIKIPKTRRCPQVQPLFANNASKNGVS